jgi:hypothetical protein
MHHTNVRKSLTWRAPEFLYKKKTPLWYTHISVFFFLVFTLFFFARMYWALAIIGALYWFFITHADDQPKTVDYKIDSHSITVGERKLSYGEIHSFTVDASNSHPVIVLDLNYTLSLPVTLIVKKSELDETKELLSRYLPGQNKLSFIRWLTHKLHY